jgi:O-antigen/teichoic acid export membrane protein
MRFRQLIFSSATLMASQLLTAGVGFFFWFVAARRFDQASVGFTSGVISAMMLLGALSTVGLGTLLIREMPQNPGREHRMLSAALIASAVLGGIAGAGFVVIAPLLSHEFAPLTTDPRVWISVIVGSSLTAASLNADQALIGLLHPGLQLLRNAVAAAGRLGLLSGAVLLGLQAGNAVMLGSWSVALVLSLALLALLALQRGRLGSAFPPAWEVVDLRRSSALKHHILNLSIQIPGWVMPLMTVAVLSAATNARFYVAWLLVGLASFVPVAFTWSLYAGSARDLTSLARVGKITLFLSLLAAFLSAIGLWVLGHPMLSVLGSSYATVATGPLQILSITLLPSVIKAHYVTIHRVRGTLTSASIIVAGAGALEIVGATIGARLGDLTGLSLGLLAAMSLEAIVMFPTVYEAILAPQPEVAAVRGEPSWEGE